MRPRQPAGAGDCRQGGAAAAAGQGLGFELLGLSLLLGLLSSSDADVTAGAVVGHILPMKQNDSNFVINVTFIHIAFEIKEIGNVVEKWTVDSN